MSAPMIVSPPSAQAADNPSGRPCGADVCPWPARVSLLDEHGRWHYRCAEHYAGSDELARTWRTHEVVDSAPSTIPNLGDALALERTALGNYLATLSLAFHAHCGWAYSDDTASRERYRAILRLMAVNRTSFSANKDSATQDGEYVAFRDELRRLSNTKLAAEADRDTAHTRLISARLVVEAALALAARDGGRGA